MLILYTLKVEKRRSAGNKILHTELRLNHISQFTKFNKSVLLQSSNDKQST